MSFNDIMKDLKNRKFYPVYFLMGEEDYFIDQVTDYISKNVLKEEERDFNQTVVYGSDTSLPQIIIEARRFPMMAERQVIIVREGQNVKDIDGGSSEKDQSWVNYASNPITTTLLVVVYRGKTLDKRKKFYKSLEKTGVILESKALYESKMPEWIFSYVKEKGYDIQPAAAQVLVSHLGTNLTKIVNGLAKLMTFLPKGTTINGQHIEDNIGISKEYNVFELNKAIGMRDTTKVYTIAAHFAKNQKDNPIQMVVSQLFTYFVKILLVHTSYRTLDKNSLASALGVNPYFVGEYQDASRNYSKIKVEKVISYLRHYDAYSKGVNDASTDKGELLKELVALILA
ncbi:MAG: DNA polymerase III subunit delta [Salinivirgaceae bacterium]|nr:DNA polymerase III subunit delta [Salinivirgaceae bacterium]MDD4746083.1 DNA polymerase III subunit delta [Salinivirgaceae bacterium]MDY0280264.1 DNA polymerase III subunit delta [Salinivirgaceae bacterium]